MKIEKEKDFLVSFRLSFHSLSPSPSDVLVSISIGGAEERRSVSMIGGGEWLLMTSVLYRRDDDLRC